MVRAVLKDGYMVRMKAGSHEIIADEPKDVGGTDIGPSPYELVMSALGACTAMTMRMYAKRKAWALDEVEVTLRHNKIYAEECEHCMESSGKVDQFERIISMKGDLDDDQRKRLMEIANKCPVHKTLEGNASIKTEMA